MRGNQEFFLLALEGRQPTGTLSGHGGIVGFVGFVGYLRQVSVPSVAKQVASILYRAAERQELGNTGFDGWFWFGHGWFGYGLVMVGYGWFWFGGSFLWSSVLLVGFWLAGV